MKKQILLAALAICVGMLNGMEMGIGKHIEQLPLELQQEINKTLQQLKMHDVLMFLGQQKPITIEGPKRYCNNYGESEVVSYPVTSVAISDNKIATGSKDKTVKIWDLKGKLLRTFEGNNHISIVAISGDKVVAVGDWNNGTLWNINTGQLLLEGLTSKGSINTIAIDGNIITGSYDKTAKVWDINGQLLHTLVGHTAPVYSVAIKDNIVVTGSRDKSAKVWDIQTGQLLRTLAGVGGHTDAVDSVAINDNVIVTGSWDKTAKIWDINGQLLYTLVGHTGSVYSVAISGNKVVTCSQDKTAKVWDVRNGRLLQTLAGPNGHLGGVFSVAISGNTVVTGSGDGTAKIWLLSPNLQSTIYDNTILLWTVEKATNLQWDLINRVYEATIVGQKFIIASQSEDEKVMLSFPENVRKYLLERLNIMLKK